jgi:hypothetical protein
MPAQRCCKGLEAQILGRLGDLGFREFAAIGKPAEL